MGCHTWFYRPIRETEQFEDEELDYFDERPSEKFTDIDMPQNLFRIGGYPDDVLLSLEQTMRFIEKNKTKITFSENWQEELKNFWNNNPNGVIDFG